MIVADASIIANAVGDNTADGDIARRVLLDASTVSVPDLVNVGATAVLRKRWIAKDLPTKRFEIAVDALTNLPIDRYPTVGLMQSVFELRGNVTPYDAVYVALAEAVSAELVTADRKLAAAPGPRCAIRVLQ